MSLRDLEVEIDDADRQGYFYSVAFEEGEQAGLTKGRRLGEEQGRRLGEEQGRRLGEIEMVVTVLEARRITPTPELLARLHACTPAQLRSAIVLALELHSAEALEQALRE